MGNNIFRDTIPALKVLQKQQKQYQDNILVEGQIAANTLQQFSSDVTSLGDFYSYVVTGSFSTLVDDNPNVLDNGVCNLRGKVVDGSTKRALMNDFIPLNLWLTPGRVRSSLSSSPATDAESNNLFYPIVMKYLFPIDGNIIVEMKNDSDTTNEFAIMFHGVRIVNRGRTRGIPR